MPALSTCTITAQANIPQNGAVATDGYITVHRASKAGSNLVLVPFTVKPSSGVFTIVVPRNCTIYVSGNVDGLWKDSSGNYYTESNPKALTVPDAATANLEDLAAVAAVPSAGLTIKDEGTALGSLIGTLNVTGAGASVVQNSAGVATLNVPGIGSANFANLADVSFTSLASGHFPRYNGTLWVNAALTAGDIPTGIDAVKIGGGAVSNTEFGYLDGVTSAIQTQLNGKQASLGYTAENAANKDQNSGYAGLDSSGKINPAQLPALAITDTFVVASQAAMLALTAEVGDVAVRTDLNKTFILKTAGASTLANWQELLTPTDAVTSVFGRSGAVTAQNNDYSIGQISGFPAQTGNNGKYLTTDGSTLSWATVSSGATLGANTFTGKQTIQLTTEQLRLGYDGSNYVAFTVSAAGLLAITPTGNVIEQRNGASAQSAYLYGTYTDASNYVRLAYLAGGNYTAIQSQAAGSGVGANVLYITNTQNAEIQFQTNNTNRWQVSNGGHWLANGSHNTYDIGASGSNSPRTGYFATSVVTPLLNLSATLTPTGTADSQGATGDHRYDDNFIYVKTSGGWKRAALATF